MNFNTLFEALCFLKERGYKYVNVNDCGCHVGFDQSVADYYDGFGDSEPSYIDWMKQTSFDLDNYVLCHEGKLYYGSIIQNTINSDITFNKYIIDAELDSSIVYLKREVINIDIPGLLSVGIWLFGLKNESDRINTLVEYSKGINSEDTSVMCVEAWGQYSFLFLSHNSWSDTDFIIGILKLQDDYHPEELKYFFARIDPAIKTSEFVEELFTFLPKTASYFFPDYNSLISNDPTNQ